MLTWIPILTSLIAIGISIAGFLRTRSTQTRDRLLQVERRRQDCLNRLFALELTHVETLRVLEKIRRPAALGLNGGESQALVEGFLADTRLARELIAGLDFSNAPLKAEIILEEIIGQLAIMEADSKRGMAMVSQLESMHASLVSGMNELNPEETEEVLKAMAAELANLGSGGKLVSPDDDG